MGANPTDDVPVRRARREQPTIVLPPLTPATIKRAKQGLTAGRDRRARRAVNQALSNAEQMASGRPDRRINGDRRRSLLKTMIHTLFQVQVEHPENIPDGPAVLAPNHLNHIDPFLVLAEVPPQPYYYILGDARTMYNKAWKRALLRRSGGIIPLDRLWKEEQAVIEGARDGHAELADLAEAIRREVPDGGSIEALRQLDRIVQAIFQRGDSILIFPEGGLGTMEGRLRLPLKRGTVIYAIRSGVPIVPVGLIGTRDLYLRKRLTVRFGTPLQFPRSSRPRPGEVQDALETLEAAIQSLLSEDYREPPGPKLLRGLLNRMLW
jgi:1-acyl-sn-glycerol-3-phosphate acyltransferase